MNATFHCADVPSGQSEKSPLSTAIRNLRSSGRFLEFILQNARLLKTLSKINLLGVLIDYLEMMNKQNTILTPTEIYEALGIQRLIHVQSQQMSVQICITQ